MTGAHTAPPATSLHLLRLTDGLIVHQTLCAAARLGIADLLKDGPRQTSELAAALHVNGGALYRILRFLAGQGVFHETAPREFANSALSQWLRTDVPGSVRSILTFRGSPYYFFPFGDLLSSIATGAPARNRGVGMDAFEYLRHHPEEARVFDDAMTDISGLWAQDVVAAYDFGKWGSLMDLGGGNGLLLATILRAYPTLRGVLADQPHVLERARERDFWAGLAGRVRFEPADFFQSVPSGCRAFMMKNVIHDWDDEPAREILLNCRRAVPGDGVLLLVEYALGAENTPSLGKALDIVMLATTGGKERTIDEHRDLLAGAGFRLNSVIPLSNEVMILEATPGEVNPVQQRDKAWIVAKPLPLGLDV
jgi:O-methyltransferase domain